MKIRRTFKPISLKHGKTEYCDESTFTTVAKQTTMGQHAKGQCSTEFCTHCAEPVLGKLKAGAKVETFFSIFEMDNGGAAA